MDRDVELQLVAALRAGDARAFDRVYDSLNDRLYNFLARLTNSHHLAEDLVEETWMRLVTHAHRLRADTRLAPWLFTVARHLFASYCRSRLVEDATMADLLTLWPSGAHHRTPLEAAEANEARRELAAALASLPVGYREALLLVGVEGFSPAEAAEVCGISAEAMRQRICRARKVLAERLDAPVSIPLKSWREVTP